MDSQHTTTAPRRWAAAGAAIAATLFSVPFVFGQAAAAENRTDALDVTITVADHVYDGGDTATLTECTVDTVVDPVLTCTVSGTGVFESTDVADGITVDVSGATITLSDDSVHSVGSVTAIGNITPLELTGITVNVADHEYDGFTAATIDGCTFANAIGGDDITCDDNNDSNFDDKNAGDGKSVTLGTMSLSGGDAGNYSWTAPTTATGNIIPLDVAATLVTADGKPYDTTDAAVISDCVLDPAIISPDVVTCTGTGTFDSADAGLDKPVTVLTLALGGTDAGNYNLTTTDFSGLTPTAAIDPIELTIDSVTVDDKTYDGTTDATITACALVTDDILGEDDVTCNFSSATATFDDPNVATDIDVDVTGLTLDGDQAGNYTLASDEASTTADITAAELTVTADDQSVTYGDSEPADEFYTFVITGFVTGEDENDLTAAPICSSGYAQGDVVDTYVDAITCDSAAAANYSFTYVDGDLTVDPATLTVTADDETITYGQAAPSPLGATVTGWVLGEDADSATGYTPADCEADYTPGDPAGRYPITCSGATADNYTFDYVDGWLTVEALVLPADAVWYTGPTSVRTSSTSETLAKVTLSAVISVDLGGDGFTDGADCDAASVADAKITFSEMVTGKVFAKDVAVAEVDGNCEEGIATVMTTVSTGQNGTEFYVIVATATGSMTGSNIDDDPSSQLEFDYDSMVLAVALPTAPGTLSGMGDLAWVPPNGATDKGTSGALTAGMDIANPATVTFRFVPGAKKVLPKGQTVVIIPAPAAEGGLYYIKSNSITSITVGATVTTVYTKATISHVGGTCATTCLSDGGAILRLDVASDGRVAYTVQSGKTSALYYSNHWLKSGKVWGSVLQYLS